jgi:lipopolysaccharide/colanic/teichoic acid biosynthesis glycosyltransferase
MSARGFESVYPNPLAEIEKKKIGIFQRVIPSDTLMGLKRSLQIGGMPFIALRAHSLSKSRSTFKRLIELFYLTIGLIPLILIAALVASYVRLVAGRNIIYRQERTGKFGQPFMMLKFRTMTKNAEIDTGVIKAAPEDSRIISGLDWLRKTRLDEIPQFINVLKGEMSIIGPRPERPDFTDQYQIEIPGYERRHDIAPGITGLAQVKGRYHTDPSYKLGHDLQYLVNWSPILDIQILIETIWTILVRRL